MFAIAGYLLAFEIYGFKIFLFPIQAFCYVLESKLYLLMKIILLFVLGWLSLLSVTLIPIYQYLFIKYVFKFVFYLVGRSRILPILFGLILIAATIVHLRNDSLDFFEKYFSMINITTVLTVIMISSEFLHK